jgi:hypothetical protein
MALPPLNSSKKMKHLLLLLLIAVAISGASKPVRNLVHFSLVEILTGSYVSTCSNVTPKRRSRLKDYSKESGNQSFPTIQWKEQLKSNRSRCKR